MPYLRLLLWGALLCVLPGCQLFPSHDASNQQTIPRFQSLWLSYRVTPTNAASQPDARHQLLTLQYPHPGGKANYARAELIVFHYGPGGTPASSGWLSSVTQSVREKMPGIQLAPGVDESLGIDLPLSQLDKVVAALNSQGFFQAQPAPESDVWIATTINGVPCQKPWKQVREIEGVMSRLRHEGKLVSVKSLPAPLDPRQIMLTQTPAIGAPQVNQLSSPGLAAPLNPAFGGNVPVNYQAPLPPQTTAGESDEVIRLPLPGSLP